MRRLVVLVCLIAASACTSSSRGRVEQVERDATAAIRRGELLAAQRLAQQGIDRTRDRPDSASAWTFRLLLAESLALQQKPADSRAALNGDIPAAREFDSLRARRKYVEARAFLDEGKLREALNTVEAGRALPAAPDTKFDLEVLSGQLRLRLGERAAAESALQAVVESAASAGDHYHQALALNDLGMGRLIRNRFDDALSWFERVLALRDLEPLRIYAQSLNNAGICYNQLGEFDRAIDLQRHAVAMHERRGLTNSYEQALGELGRTYLARGDAVQALGPLQRAYEVARDARINDDAAVWAGALADAHVTLAQWDAAASFNDQATDLKRKSNIGRLAWNTLNAATIAAGRGQSAEARRLYEEAIASAGDDPAVQWEAHAGIARVALNEGRPDRARDAYERALSVIEQTRATLNKTEYKLSYLSSLIRVYQQYVDALIRDGRVEQALEVADSSRARVLAERHGTAAAARVSAAAFRSVASRSGRVMLFYWLGPKQSYMWIVTAGGVHGAPLPSGDRIAALVRDHQQTIASALADPLAAANASGDELYRTLVGPVAQWIPPGASLFIVPDGALHGLNFETLPVASGPDRRRYWIEDVDIEIVPSLGLLSGTLAAPPHRDAPSLLLIGAPDVSDPSVAPLRYATAEMTRIAAHFDAVHVASYAGNRASPAAYFDAKPNRYSMIHFAAHATANAESPLDSAVILASAAGAGYKLYARDVAQTPLQADLVTVSSCRSAGERAYSGEGLIGFAWAFLRAGARRVIAGLWDVDDRSTADLMDALYVQLADGVPPSRALRTAKISMLKRGAAAARPYYWGAFELFTVTP